MTNAWLRGVFLYDRLMVNMQQQAQLVTEIAKALAAMAPAGWTQIEYIVTAVGGRQSSKIFTDSPQGRVQHNVPVALHDMIEALRGAMYQDGKGTFYSATFTVTSANNGSVNTTFNYQDEPTVTFPPDQYRLDLTQFPRTPENTPDWLRGKLAAAAELGPPPPHRPSRRSHLHPNSLSRHRSTPHCWRALAARTPSSSCSPRCWASSASAPCSSRSRKT